MSTFITFTPNPKCGGFVNISKAGNGVQRGPEVCVLEAIHPHSRALTETSSNTAPPVGKVATVTDRHTPSCWKPKEDPGIPWKRTGFGVQIAARHGHSLDPPQDTVPGFVTQLPRGCAPVGRQTT